MNPGELNTVLSFKAITSAVSAGNFTETESASVDIRVKLRQLEGYKKMQYTELLTKEVYEAMCFDNTIITKDSICLNGSDELVVYSRVRNPGKSGTNEVKLILWKKSSGIVVNVDSQIVDVDSTSVDVDNVLVSVDD